MLSKRSPLKDEAAYRSEVNGQRSICHANSNLKSKTDIRAGSFIRDKNGQHVMTKKFIFQEKIIHSVFTVYKRVKLCEARADWTGASTRAVGNFNTRHQ